MPSHEHQWVYTADVVIPTKENEVLGDPFNRQEYCIVCGALRVKFKRGGWSYLYADAVKQFLNQFDHEAHKVLKLPPTGYKFGPPVRDGNRLGRGLKDLAETMVGGQGWKELFKKGKPDAKDK